MEHDSPKLLFRQACEYLSSSRLVRPGVVQHPGARRGRAGAGKEGDLGAGRPALLTERRCAELDGLLAVDPGARPHAAGLAGHRPVAATPAAVKAELEKLAYLRGMDADTLDLSVLPAERRRFLAGVGRRLTAQNLARREPTAGTRSC